MRAGALGLRESRRRRRYKYRAQNYKARRRANRTQVNHTPLDAPLAHSRGYRRMVMHC
jgi:hypothetical protein